MAFESNSPVTMAFPPFRGVTRRILLLAVAAFLVEFFLGLVNPQVAWLTVDLFTLHPVNVLHGMVWMLVSYPLVGMGLLNLLLAGISIWMFGAALEEERGGRWYLEYVVLTTIGGGILLTLICLFLHGAVHGLEVEQRTSGLWPLSITTLLAYAHFFPNERILFWFIARIKARHLALIYLAGYLVFILIGGNRMGALAVLTNYACGWMFLRFAPRKGLRFAVSESWYGLRNAFYRRKRKQAAKKFEVYMRQHGKDVSVKDDEKNRWMN